MGVCASAIAEIIYAIQYTNDKNPEGFKSTIKSVHETIKGDVGQGVSTLGKGVQGGVDGGVDVGVYK